MNFKFEEMFDNFSIALENVIKLRKMTTVEPKNIELIKSYTLRMNEILENKIDFSDIDTIYLQGKGMDFVSKTAIIFFGLTGSKYDYLKEEICELTIENKFSRQQWVVDLWRNKLMSYEKLVHHGYGKLKGGFSSESKFSWKNIPIE